MVGSAGSVSVHCPVRWLVQTVHAVDNSAWPVSKCLGPTHLTTLTRWTLPGLPIFCCSSASIYSMLCLPWQHALLRHVLLLLSYSVGVQSLWVRSSKEGWSTCVLINDNVFVFFCLTHSFGWICVSDTLHAVSIKRRLGWSYCRWVGLCLMTKNRTESVVTHLVALCDINSSLKLVWMLSSKAVPPFPSPPPPPSLLSGQVAVLHVAQGLANLKPTIHLPAQFCNHSCKMEVVLASSKPSGSSNGRRT